MAKRDSAMRDGIGERFALGYKRLAYDMALRDSTAFYGLGYDELYWIDLFYRDCEQVVRGQFANGEIRLRNAEFTASYLLNNLKNRHMSRHLMFSVGPPVVQGVRP